MFRVVLFVLLWTGSAIAREFDPCRDGFAFANETVLAYGVDEAGRLHMTAKEEPAKFAHRCIAIVRATLQFWKFARFDLAAPKADAETYRRKLRQLFRIQVWFSSRPASDRVVFPGYADLWSFSRANQHLVQEEIGEWLPTYLRVGNWRMPCPFTRLFQGVTARATARAMADEPQALFLAKFPSMNHAVLAYSVAQEASGKIHYRVYDPNYPGQAARLTYLPEQNLFDFESRFYWPGGLVRAFRIYLSPIH
jgi:hypothetical protein